MFCQMLSILNHWFTSFNIRKYFALNSPPPVPSWHPLNGEPYYDSNLFPSLMENSTLNKKNTGIEIDGNICHPKSAVLLFQIWYLLQDQSAGCCNKGYVFFAHVWLEIIATYIMFKPVSLSSIKLIRPWTALKEPFITWCIEDCKCLTPKVDTLNCVFLFS